jgi:hypothetical protein
MNTELPPPISPRQMDILRAVTAMAWADGVLEPDEINLMLDEFALLFSSQTSPDQQERFKARLKEYLGQNLPLEEVIPQINPEDRKLVAQLAYQVINASRRRPEEPKINLEEAAAFQRLIRLLGLSDAEVEEITLLRDSSDEPQSLAVKIHEILLKQ